MTGIHPDQIIDAADWFTYNPAAGEVPCDSQGKPLSCKTKPGQWYQRHINDKAAQVGHLPGFWRNFVAFFQVPLWLIFAWATLPVVWFFYLATTKGHWMAQPNQNARDRFHAATGFGSQALAALVVGLLVLVTFVLNTLKWLAIGWVIWMICYAVDSALEKHND